jgi:uncharacterized protein
MNELDRETSPYLLQHAHNPVHWKGWNEASLAAAKQAGKPILVSIGYSACHWCHVMERESFENEDTAEVMNKFFTNIKIDREERPDVDHIYMDAVQALTGSGGWPLNVFLTPDLKPFYGGTYFPPDNRYNRQSWKEVLIGVANAWKENQQEVIANAENLTEHLKKSQFLNKNQEQTEILYESNAEAIYTAIMKQADLPLGGFGLAPKFPQTQTLVWLLRHSFQDGIDHAYNSLNKMAQGGLFDQLAGGFCRYSTDAEWLAPHFEKMLYDNALLIALYAEAFAITKNQYYKQIVEKTIYWLKTEMMSEDGVYHSALDADSEGVEGKFYVWQKEEIKTQLTEHDFKNAAIYFDITEIGNWEGKIILRIKDKEFKKYDEFKIAKIEHKLLHTRRLRVRPSTDDKILCSWNAMLIIALAQAGRFLQIEEYTQLAINLEKKLWQIFYCKNKLLQTHKQGQTKINAMADSYAYYTEALLLLFTYTQNFSYLKKAEELTKYLIANFSDDENVYFFFTAKEATDIIVRKTELYDGATPASNSVMAQNIWHLGKIIGNEAYITRAEKMIASMLTASTKYPTSFSKWNLAYQFTQQPEIAIVGKQCDLMVKELLKVTNKPLLLIASAAENKNYPLLQNRDGAETLIYVCKNYSCQLPVKTVVEALTLL